MPTQATLFLLNFQRITSFHLVPLASEHKYYLLRQATERLTFTKEKKRKFTHMASRISVYILSTFIGVRFIFVEKA